MRIKKVVSQYRQDMHALLICETCAAEESDTAAVDDNHYHEVVLPSIPCLECGHKSPVSYIPRKPRFNAADVV